MPDRWKMTDVVNTQALQAALELSMANMSSYSDIMNITTHSTACDGPEDIDSPRTQNITQCVSVPSSEHVAEIVGRQGERR